MVGGGVIIQSHIIRPIYIDHLSTYKSTQQPSYTAGLITSDMDSSYAMAGDLTSTGAATIYAADSLPKAKDMTHHLNSLSRNRTASSLKQLYKYMTTPGMVSTLKVVSSHPGVDHHGRGDPIA